MKYRVGCTLEYAVAAPSLFLFNIAAQKRRRRQKVLEEKLEISPRLKCREQSVAETGVRYFRLEPSEPFSLRYEALVERRADKPARRKKDSGYPVFDAEAVPYLFASRYCQVDLMHEFAQDALGHLPPGAEAVQAICDWVYERLDYIPDISGPSTSALDTAIHRTGVCRDFAHLAITLCRCIGIPARFVTGYAENLPNPDFHACMEAYVNGDWKLFDPSRKIDPAELVRIGTGHDAAEASFCTIYSDEIVEMTFMQVFAESAE